MVTSQSVTRRCARPGFGGRAPRGGAEGAGVGGGSDWRGRSDGAGPPEDGG